MRYSKEFFQLQLDFAGHIAHISNQPLRETLRAHTVLNHLLNLSGDGDDLLWPQQFIQELQESKTPANYAYTAYLSRLRPEQEENHDENSLFGCFSYVYPYRDAQVVRLHFENRDMSDQGALSRERIPVRQAELKRMFQQIKWAHPEAEEVWGGSWLYNIDAYKRLFPSEYTALSTSAGYETGFFALWGQFLGRHGHVREPMASEFLTCVQEQQELESCLACFPYSVMRVKCRIETFYDFYGVRTV